ncbi:MAG: hypothetical protein WB952_10815 [Terriglobales bacterium]
MPIKVMSVEQANERFKQARKSSITGMAEWEELRIKVGAGLKRGEAVVVELTPDPKNKNLRASFKRNVRKLVKRLKMDYTVRAMRSGDVDVVIVANEEHPVSTRKR